MISFPGSIAICFTLEIASKAKKNGKRKRRICETIRRTREKRGATYLKRKTRLSASSISFSRIGMDYKVDLSLSIDMAGIRKGG